LFNYEAMILVKIIYLQPQQILRYEPL